MPSKSLIEIEDQRDAAEASAARYQRSAQAQKKRLNRAIRMAELFIVRGGMNAAVTWHASGANPTTSLAGLNLYRAGGTALFILGIARQIKSGNGEFVASIGEGMLQPGITVKVIAYRTKGLNAAQAALRAQQIVTRLGGVVSDDKPAAGGRLLDVASPKRLGQREADFAEDTDTMDADEREQIELVQEIARAA